MSAPAASPLERTCARQRIDLAVIAEAVARACSSCGAVYLDIPNGRDAHQVVFGHQPATPSREADS